MKKRFLSEALWEQQLIDISNELYIISYKDKKQLIQNISSKIDISGFEEIDKLLKNKSNEASSIKSKLNEIEQSTRNSFLEGVGWNYGILGAGCLSYYIVVFSLAVTEMGLTEEVVGGALALLAVYLPIKKYKRKKEIKNNLLVAAELQNSLRQINMEIIEITSKKFIKAQELFEKRKAMINQHKVLTRALDLTINLLTFVSINDWVRVNKYFHQKKIERGFNSFACETVFEKNGNVIVESRSGLKSLFMYDAELTQPTISKLKKFYLSFLNSNTDLAFYISNKAFSLKGIEFARENAINLLTTEQFIYIVVENIKDPFIFPIKEYVEEGDKKQLEIRTKDLISRHKETYDIVKEFFFSNKAPSYEETYEDKLNLINFGFSCVFEQKSIIRDVLRGVEETALTNFKKLIQHE